METQPTILLVEDDGDDVFWLKRAVRKTPFTGVIYIAANGLAAISYLCGEEEFADREKYPFPDMVITDLKMPKMSGLELVQWIRAEPKLSRLPVIVISSSSLETDRFRALSLGANDFLTKPMCEQDFGPLMKIVCECGKRSLLSGTMQNAETNSF